MIKEIEKKISKQTADKQKLEQTISTEYELKGVKFDSKKVNVKKFYPILDQNSLKQLPQKKIVKIDKESLLDQF